MNFKPFSENKNTKSSQKKWEEILEVVEIVDPIKEKKKKKREKKAKDFIKKVKNFIKKVKNKISFLLNFEIYWWSIKSILVVYLFSCIISLIIYTFIVYPYPFINLLNVPQTINLISKNIISISVFTISWWFIIPWLIWLISTKVEWGSEFLQTILLILLMPVFWLIFVAGLSRPFILLDFLWSLWIWLYIPYVIIYFLIIGYFFGKYE